MNEINEVFRSLGLAAKTMRLNRLIARLNTGGEVIDLRLCSDEPRGETAHVVTLNVHELPMTRQDMAADAQEAADRMGWTIHPTDAASILPLKPLEPEGMDEAWVQPEWTDEDDSEHDSERWDGLS